jgi:guanylate kinase
LLILSAPSGAGKTTLARRLVAATPGSIFSVSYTTRSPRGAEKDGVDYHFVEPKVFQQKIERGEFVEWAEVHGHFYGSPQAVVDQSLKQNCLAVFDIDVQGGLAIKRKYPATVLVLVLPPSLEELERRLRARKTETDDIIRRRLLAGRAEIERGLTSYDFLVVNDELDVAFEKIQAIVIAEGCRRGRSGVASILD